MLGTALRRPSMTCETVAQLEFFSVSLCLSGFYRFVSAKKRS